MERLTDDDRLFNPLLTISSADFGLRPLFLGIFFGAFGIETRSAAESLLATYRCAKHYLAPLMVKAAVDMLPSLRAAVEADERTRIIFAGRDSFSLGNVISVIDPEFFGGHCHNLYLTRALVDAAVAGMEESGTDVRHIGPYRKRAPGPARHAAWDELRRYLTLSGIDLDSSRGKVLVVDTGYKGSIQEMLAVLYPHVVFQGHYVFHAGSDSDPHPGSKRGYVLDVPAGPGTTGTAVRGALPERHELTFTHHEAIVAVEELLQGSHLSPSRLEPTGRPRTVRARWDDDAHEGLNPFLIRGDYCDPVRREAVLAFNVIAVTHVAKEIAVRIDPQDPAWYGQAVRQEWYRELETGLLRLRAQLRAWISRTPDAESDEVLTGMLDSFVHRADRRVVNRLGAALSGTRATAAQLQWAWQIYDRHRTQEAREKFVDNITAGADQLTVALPVVPGDAAPMLRIRERSVAVLLKTMPSLPRGDADRLSRALGDNLAALELAAGTLAATGAGADWYLDAFREQAAVLLSSDIKVVASLPLLAARDLAARWPDPGSATRPN
ncbi:hypothetical protein [Streptacidiphilus sp. P02-A3a]|uniref:hypothetical protein n=1 Tax=Streptacidiphilus sp. P02-A3a TaxID=2704468 RepID=UPI0015FBA33D|nr:hypothetical protein [Streptacidiphilus sp. P02-A3a]QMU69976.1 hypothetical protein GXP74_18835 [Streptacidiphilus sp. P02-A3a]